jgi:hypothetical protein
MALEPLLLNIPAARFKHKKRGSTYRLLFKATAQCSTRPIQDGDEVAVYASEEGTMSIWVRCAEEMLDGRFEILEVVT